MDASLHPFLNSAWSDVTYNFYTLVILPSRNELGEPLAVLEVMGEPLTVPNVMVEPLTVLEVMGEPLTVLDMMGEPLTVLEVMGESLTVLEVMGEPPTVLEVMANRNFLPLPVRSQPTGCEQANMQLLL
jgi:hypothetical protein